jgi:transketolase
VAIENINSAYKPNQDVFASTVLQLASNNKNLVVVTSDSRGSGKLVPFGQQLPSQIVEVGIAEQNLVGVAAGLAAFNKIVFAVSPACFLTARSLEQIKNDVAYSNNKVILVGISAGVSYGALGSTHHSIHDFAVLRAIHNLAIVAPADNFETAAAVSAAIQSTTPVYLRFGKKPMPSLTDNNNDFEIGKARIIKQGEDIAIIANGETVYPALQAASLLKENNINATVISMHTIKPLDTELLHTLLQYQIILTVEEHSIYGGLGEACASYLLQNRFSGRFVSIGFPDEYTITGSQTEIFNHYNISAEGIQKQILFYL